VLDHENAHAGRPFHEHGPAGKFGLGSAPISALSDWPGLDLRHLAALDAIAREGSVSRAAASLGYTQSAVSQQLLALERIVGVTLVARSPGARTAEITAAGRQLLEHAGAIAGHLESARAELAALAGGRAGELRIGAVPSVAGALIPALAEQLRERAPHLALHVGESYYAGELLDRLAAGALDIVLAPADDPRDGLVSEALLRDPYVLLVPSGDPFMRLAGALTASDLARRDLIGKDCATASQRALSAALRDEGLGPPRIRAHDLREVKAMVRRGLGVAVVPRLLLDGLEPELAAIPVDHLVPDRVIELTTRADGSRTPAADVAAELLRAHAAAPAGR
jgi:molybdate transport repressor ModE-like protein